MNQHRRSPEDALIAKEGQEANQRRPKGCPHRAKMNADFAAYAHATSWAEARGWAASQAYFHPAKSNDNISKPGQGVFAAQENGGAGLSRLNRLWTAVDDYAGRPPPARKQ